MGCASLASYGYSAMLIGAIEGDVFQFAAIADECQHALTVDGRLPLNDVDEIDCGHG